jgi:hypothetical protein
MPMRKSPGQCFALELKAEKAPAYPKTKRTFWFVSDTVDEAIRCLERHNLLKGRCF